MTRPAAERPAEPTIEDHSGGDRICHVIARERRNRFVDRLILLVLAGGAAITLGMMAILLGEALSAGTFAIVSATVVVFVAVGYIGAVKSRRPRGFEVWIEGGGLAWRAAGQPMASVPVSTVEKVYVVDSLDFEGYGETEHEVRYHWLMVMTPGGTDHTIAQVGWIAEAERQRLVDMIRRGLEQHQNSAQ